VSIHNTIIARLMNQNQAKNYCWFRHRSQNVS
jgi:hypothetical protein